MLLPDCLGLRFAPSELLPPMGTRAASPGKARIGSPRGMLFFGRLAVALPASHPKKAKYFGAAAGSLWLCWESKSTVSDRALIRGMLLASGPHPALPRVSAAPSELLEKTSLRLSSGAAKNKQREYLLLGNESGGILLNVPQERGGCERSFGQGQREEKCTQGRERRSVGLVERRCR